MTHRNDTQPTPIDWSLVGWAALIGAAGALAAGIVLIAGLNVPTGRDAVIVLVLATVVAAILLAVTQVLAQRLWGGRNGYRAYAWSDDTPTVPLQPAGRHRPENIRGNDEVAL